MKHFVLLLTTLFLTYYASVEMASVHAIKNNAPKNDQSPSAFSTPIHISGDKTFTNHTNAALKLLKNKAPSDYTMVITYIGKIQQHTFSGMAAYETPPAYKVGAITANASVTWYASTIVHDAYHSKLYHDYLYTYKEAVPDEAWTGMEAEMKCLEAQIQSLIQIKAPKTEIDYARSLRGTNWWDLNGDGIYDAEDEKLRDW
ncbi:hypothetical protein [Aneurinibacillus aneurinilyticus]|uniref:hypothetical protein n=1 Tax=Aneurinibacillus aneurinilyticus TaxID=1391 RepID=UPI0023F15673|nr:hypothetical protein [Aneurinibacillus aneurinilyticus]